MSDHDTWEEEIAAYVAGRLDEGVRRRVEAHLRDCRPCSELAASVREIAEASGDRDESDSATHPDSLRLRDLALGRGSGDDLLARHLAECASCALEAAVWREREGRPPGSAARRVTAAPFRTLIALAAGLLAGAGAGAWYASRTSPPIRFSAIADRPPDRPGTPATPWSGAVQLFFLPNPLRGAEQHPVLRPDPSAPVVLVALQPDLPATLTGTALCRFSIQGIDGGTTWSVDLNADSVRAHLQQSEAVTFAIPASALPPGRYEMRLITGDRPDGSPLLQRPFEILPPG